MDFGHSEIEHIFKCVLTINIFLLKIVCLCPFTRQSPEVPLLLIKLRKHFFFAINAISPVICTYIQCEHAFPPFRLFIMRFQKFIQYVCVFCISYLPGTDNDSRVHYVRVIKRKVVSSKPPPKHTMVIQCNCSTINVFMATSKNSEEHS